jgi:hypothetical protein
LQDYKGQSAVAHISVLSVTANQARVNTQWEPIRHLNQRSRGKLPSLSAPVRYQRRIKRFWDLESIGITTHQDKSWGTKDSAVLQSLHDSFRIEDSRTVVSLPKENVHLLYTQELEFWSFFFIFTYFVRCRLHHIITARYYPVGWSSHAMPGRISSSCATKELHGQL